MRFYDEHIPIAKKRHRVGNGRMYDPQYKEKLKMKWIFAAQFRDAGYLKPLTGAISVYLNFGLPIPKSWSKKRKKLVLDDFVITRPDLDNYCKMYLDVLNQIAYEDDSQVVTMDSQKRYSNKPYIEIIINQLEDNTMINEHAITFKNKLSLEDLDYIVKKANRLGLNDRQLIRVYQEEDSEGTHVYFVVEGLKEKKDKTA